MSARRLAWLLMLGLLLVPALVSATVQASLDRSAVSLGETVTLNLRVQDPHGGGSPDLGPLAGDFTILGMSSNNAIRIVNGQRSDELTYGIALRPKHTGRLTIPPLSVGGEKTAPLTLQVTAPGPQAAAHGDKAVFLEVQAEPAVVRVGEQLTLDVRLYYAAPLSSGSLADPQVAGMDVRRLGDDVDYTADRGGRRYQVIERHYALTPQHAGQITIPPLVFQGEMVDPSDPDSFFGMGMPVSVASTPISLRVRPPPSNWGSSAWLPARELTLTLDGLPADGKLRVGVPLDLHMTLQATGLPYEALPALSLPDLRGATVYPDKPVTHTGASGRWVVGRREQGFAVVPDRAGTLVIPATTLKWWNTQTGKAELATIPVQRLTVLPATGSAIATPASVARAPAVATSTVSAPAHRKVSDRHRPAAAWWVAGTIVLVLLAGLAGWGWRRRHAPGPASAAAPPGDGPTPPRANAARNLATSARARRAEFMAVARGGEAGIQARHLLAWAQAERPGLVNLGELAAALSSADQQQAIGELQRRHYAGRDGEQPLALDRVFAKGFAWRQPEHGPADSSLPPLYPFKLH